jgi:hypothetical protein
MTDIKEVEYFSPAYPTRELLEKGVETNWDATTASQVAKCPRNAEYSVRYGLVAKDESYAMKAGGALHAALSLYYAGADGDLGLQELARVWGKGREFAPPSTKFGHLNLGFLETIFKNYMDFAKRRDTFKPLIVKFEELDMTKVVGAVFRLTPEGNVILGESKIIMDFEDVVKHPFVYSGKPDLPVESGGAIYLWDHKSTNSYLSTWYFDQYRFSNQLRGYCAMLSRMTKIQLNGALINGIYMGERAVLTDFKGDRFGRFGPMLYSPSHLDEAILNQYAWRKTLDYYEKEGYYPQHTSRLCGGCTFAELCAQTPIIRESVMHTAYTHINRSFLDL